MQQPDSFLTTREATDRACYSRPDVFTRAWRAAGYSLHKLPSGRIRVSLEDFQRFMQGKPAEQQAS